MSGVWSSPGFAADLSGWTGTFTSIDKRRHLLAERGSSLSDCRYLVAEKSGISTQESPSPCWRKVASRRVGFLGFSPLIPAVWWALWPAWPYRWGRREFQHLHDALFFWVSPRRSQQCGGHCGQLGLVDGAIVSLNISISGGGSGISDGWGTLSPEAQAGELGKHDQGRTGELEEASAKIGKGEEA